MEELRNSRAAYSCVRPSVGNAKASLLQRIVTSLVHNALIQESIMIFREGQLPVGLSSTRRQLQVGPAKDRHSLRWDVAIGSSRCGWESFS